MGPKKGRVGGEAIWRALLDFIYPPHCLLCRTPLGGEEICGVCWTGLEVIEGPRCGRCGCPVETDRNACGNCADKVFEFSQLIVLSPFNRSIQQLIHMLKYQGRTLPGRVLGRGLGTALKGRVAAESLVVPVPLHSSRQRERGYNQSALIARAAGKVLGLQIREGILRRIRSTRTQTALDLQGRTANVEGAFRVRWAEGVRDRTVLLVDDVVTTGSTANACTEALLAAGAREVFVAAVACPYFEGR